MAARVVLGCLLIVAGVVIAVLFALPRFLEIDDRIASFPKTRLSEGAVQLARGEYSVYLDVPAGTGEFGWTLSVRDAAGHDVRVRPASGSVTYSWGGREGSRIGTLRVTSPGRHLVRGSGPPGARVVFADDVVGGIGRTILMAAVIFLGCTAAGIVLIVLGAARRRPREAKRWP